MSCLVNNDHVQQLKLGLYEIKNDTLLDSLKGFQTMEPSLYKYIEYIIGANHETLNDLRRNTNISILSPKIIEKSKVYKQLKKLLEAISGQLGLAKLSHFFQIFLNNLLERPQPLPPGFRVAEVVDINGEDIFAVNIQEYIRPGNRQLVLHQENMYQEHLQPRYQQQEAEQVGQQQQQQQQAEQVGQQEAEQVGRQQQQQEEQQEEQQQEEELVAMNNDENPGQDVDEFGVQFNNHQGEPCSICDTLADRALACLHKFCLDCLQEWSLRQRTCPLCRHPF
ncbi:hypothetical protein HCN44_000869 [Aphidius gifuensis]|uniref:RING-type domain-containing protein n=1 Tax=Aphidius gifuensis TaxID=684658 RepID=A0A834XVM8_APHGI|nr:signal transducer and activator of transcription C-like [Aphidius gifuensis]KAF7992019.1 hypothetical protein HCN44_000869 [Aphidius gifuensis]